MAFFPSADPCGTTFFSQMEDPTPRYRVRVSPGSCSHAVDAYPNRAYRRKQIDFSFCTDLVLLFVIELFFFVRGVLFPLVPF